MSRSCAAWLLVSLLGGLGCVDEPPEPVPDFEWQGEWIDVWGWDRQPEETCAGSFEYLDGFAGAVAQEYGLDMHMGVYRWFSPERFADEDPCNNPDLLGCAGANGVFSARIPLEHEVVHLTKLQTTRCPAVLSEGLAEYYGTTSKTPTSGDIRTILEQEDSSSISYGDYPIAGAFAAYLVEEYGLEPIIESCHLSGYSPAPEQLADAMSSAFGVPLEQLLTDFEAWQALGCDYSQYRAKLYECGGPPSVEIGFEVVELDVTLDCADARTIGPREGEIWTLDAIHVAEPGGYTISLRDEDGTFIDELGFEMIECGSCKDAPIVEKYPPDPEIGGLWVFQLDVGDYYIRLWGNPEFAGSMTLTFSP